MPRYVFQIIDKCFQDASHIDVDSDVDFLLEESDWNDYGYMTLYGVSMQPQKEVEMKKLLIWVASG